MKRNQTDPLIAYQKCDECGNVTNRCEDDSIFFEDHGTLCDRCLDEYEMIAECVFGENNDSL